jgi:hypothetical protein
MLASGDKTLQISSVLFDVSYRNVLRDSKYTHACNYFTIIAAELEPVTLTFTHQKC